MQNEEFKKDINVSINEENHHFEDTIIIQGSKVDSRDKEIDICEVVGVPKDTPIIVNVIGNVGKISNVKEVNVTGNVVGDLDASVNVKVNGDCHGNITAGVAIELCGACNGNIKCGTDRIAMRR